MNKQMSTNIEIRIVLENTQYQVSSAGLEEKVM